MPKKKHYIFLFGELLLGRILNKVYLGSLRTKISQDFEKTLGFWDMLILKNNLVLFSLPMKLTTL